MIVLMRHSDWNSGQAAARPCAAPALDIPAPERDAFLRRDDFVSLDNALIALAVAARDVND
jgi:hypothetical protein